MRSMTSGASGIFRTVLVALSVYQLSKEVAAPALTHEVRTAHFVEDHVQISLSRTIIIVWTFSQLHHSDFLSIDNNRTSKT